MKQKALQDQTTAELVNQFAAIGVEQYEAELVGDRRKFNRLYLKKVATEKELKSRPGDQRKALLTLFHHANVQVRLNAAKSTLAIAPVAARKMLQTIADSKEYPQAGDAGMSLVNLDRGIFKPN